MQIGTRWPVGGRAPAGLPERFVNAVVGAERDHALTSGVWTLTWLEGRPVAEHPAEIRVSLGVDGAIRVQAAVHDSGDHDSGDRDSGDRDSRAPVPGEIPGMAEDDDDWLAES